MTKTKMVVFDMAGTTIDEDKLVYKSVCEALRNAGLEITTEQVMSEIAGWNKKHGIAFLVEKYLKGSSPAAQDKIHDDFIQIVENHYRNNIDVKEMPGASEVFEHLKEQEILIVLDTGYSRRTADLLINRMGWDEKGLIDYSVTSDEVEKGRPHPFMIQKALSHFGVEDPRSVVKVGDAPADIEEGFNAGCGKVVAMLSNNPNKKKVLSKGPTHSIHNLRELLEIV